MGTVWRWSERAGMMLPFEAPGPDPPKRKRKPKPRPPEYIPTLRDIEEATAKIREGWSEAEHKKRAGVIVPPWTFPMVRLDDLFQDFVEGRIDEM